MARVWLGQTQMGWPGGAGTRSALAAGALGAVLLLLAHDLLMAFGSPAARPAAAHVADHPLSEPAGHAGHELLADPGEPAPPNHPKACRTVREARARPFFGADVDDLAHGAGGGASVVPPADCRPAAAPNPVPLSLVTSGRSVLQVWRM